MTFAARLHASNASPASAAANDSALNIAVIGSGISGLSAAWLLAQRHRVTLFEADSRAGGHSNTVEVPDSSGRPVPVDTGFIVYNEAAYPNLTALFAHLGVATDPSDMSFAVSMDGGRLEYSGSGLRGLFAQPANLVSPRFWSMLRDLVRFYRQAPADAERCNFMPLDDYLRLHGYGRAFREDHLYPMAAAIWSAPASRIGAYPTEAFVRFCENHQLLTLGDRAAWRTVRGGSQRYVQALTGALEGAPGGSVRLGCAAMQVRSTTHGAEVRTEIGSPEHFDHVVVATHADQALRLLADPTHTERRLLRAFAYSRNHAVLHTDPALMPVRRAVWSSWNYLWNSANTGPAAPCVSYWLNRLQRLPGVSPIFLTLNPSRELLPGQVLRTEVYEHPLFDATAIRAQRDLWSIQGRRRIWFCGSYFGSGFHEDGLQAGLAVAEALGGVRRPWRVANESGRIHLPSPTALVP